jgi:signal transduction histidine kinase
MEYLFYLRLIAFTAGSLLFLFLLVLLAGLRRPRLFESLLFLTGICLFLFYAGGLLAMNAEIYYASPPPATMRFATGLMLAGLAFLPALLVQGCFEYLRRIRKIELHGWQAVLVDTALYAPLPLLGVALIVLLKTPFWLLRGPLFGLRALYSICLAAALFISASFHWFFARLAPSKDQAKLHVGLGIQLVLIGVLVFLAFSLLPLSSAPYRATQVLESLVLLAPLVPGSQLGYFFLRRRFLPAGVQRNLIFTMTAGFLALLYLTVARRASVWFEQFLPPEATVSILLFILVIFFAPLQRRMGAILRRTFRAEAEQLQRLTAEIQHVARAGNLSELISFAESRIRDSFSLSGVRISLRDAPGRPAVISGNVQRFILRNGPVEIGVLEAYFLGQVLSGETHAALEYLAEQLPAAVDLCRLLDDKLRLERELAERERLALVGQMAASISHNLRNPLSSMKTLLQVQLENPQLPDSLRNDCQLIVAEVDRLSAKLNQLLRYAKPPVRSSSGISPVTVDAAALAEQVVSLLRHEAERRRVSLELLRPHGPATVAGSAEALSDVLSNLIVNAIEAVPAGGSVRVRLDRRPAGVILEITDDGPGIPADVRQKIFQPFFSTKPNGTGLGLAIVARRLAEMGASVTCESPARDARGTRFTVTLRPPPDSS